MADQLLHAAACGFEAARQLSALPAARRMHGHSFQASVRAQLPSDWETFPGSGVEQLQQRLQACVAPLDYRQLDLVLDDPTDVNLARWLAARLDLPGTARVGIRSRADTGVELDERGHAQVWRRYRFEAAHRLPNVPAGHQCGRMHGHGFEVVLHAAADGADGHPIDHQRLDSCWQPLADQLHHRCLNDLPGLENPTSEMLAAWIWERLQPQLPELGWVRVYETASCGANFDGSSYRIWKEFRLDSAVRLAHAPAADARRGVHGHTFVLRLHLHAPLDALLGWTIDYGDVKRLFDPVFRDLDHQPLHQRPELADADSASLARWIRARAGALLPQLERLDLYQTPGCGVILDWGGAAPAVPI